MRGEIIDDERIISGAAADGKRIGNADKYTLRGPVVRGSENKYDRDIRYWRNVQTLRRDSDVIRRSKRVSGPFRPSVINTRIILSCIYIYI